MSDDELQGCTAEDYRTACEALAFGQNAHAEARMRWNNEGYRALLAPAEFHDRALRLARSIAFERALQGQKDKAP